MNAIAWIAEQRIQQAIDEGAFDNLALRGRPLRLEDDQAIPPELRMAFKILKDAGCLPPEVELRKEIATLGQLLEAVVDDADRARIRRELHDRSLRLALLRERAP